jgi:predicted methyltransferase
MFIVKFYEYYNNELYHHCGSSHTHYHHLKTVRGVLNRLNSKGYAIPKNTIRIDICNSNDKVVYSYNT